MPQSLDPQAVALAKAIRQTESGGNFTVKGKSGEYGAYQFMPDTWKGYAKEAGVSTSLDKATPEEQNQVAYTKIKKWKDQGYNPGQIASMWNAGPGKPNAYIEGNKGTNSLGVSYDTGAYAKKVATYYQQFKPQGAGQIPGTDVPSPQLGTPTSFLGDVGHTLTTAGTGVSDALSKSLSGQINPLSGLIQGAGAVAGGIGGLTNNVLEHAPIVGGAYKGLEGLIGQGVGALAQTNTGKGLVANYQQFAQSHPELAGDLEAGVNIASAIPALKGIGLAKGAIKSGVTTALKGATDAALETVAPKLTAGEAAKALTSRGTVQKGLLRETQIAPDPYMQKVANAVKTNVPRFNPSKPLLTNIAEVQKVTTKMAADLKNAVEASGANKIYPKQELISRLRKLEKPDLIASDNTLNNVYDRLIKRVSNLADTKGGKISNLLDLRQEFDQIVKRQYPNLYSSDTLTPLRAGVKAIRDEITNFTAQNLPDVALKESLMTQHQLLTAIENMADKATKGSTKEIGTNAISRLGDRHPIVKGLVKTGARAAVEGTGIGAMMNLLR